MRTFAKSQIRYSKSQRIGIFALIAFIILLQIFGYFLNRNNPNPEPITVPEHVLLLDQDIENSNNQKIHLENFDPNEYTALDWQNLGFSEKQVSTIMKYKYSLGGYFSSKEEIKNCFVITEKKFEEIEPYIVFGNLNSYVSNSKSNYANSFSTKSKPKIYYEKFNPNDYSQKDWERIGYSEKQAINILKYKKMLGGKFTTLEQIRKCYMISEEKFEEMKPYIILPEKRKSQGTIELLDESAVTPKASSIQLLEEDEKEK